MFAHELPSPSAAPGLPTSAVQLLRRAASPLCSVASLHLDLIPIMPFLFKSSYYKSGFFGGLRKGGVLLLNTLKIVVSKYRL